MSIEGSTGSHAGGFFVPAPASETGGPGGKEAQEYGGGGWQGRGRRRRRELLQGRSRGGARGHAGGGVASVTPASPAFVVVPAGKSRASPEATTPAGAAAEPTAAGVANETPNAPHQAPRLPHLLADARPSPLRQPPCPRSPEDRRVPPPPPRGRRPPPPTYPATPFTHLSSLHVTALPVYHAGAYICTAFVFRGFIDGSSVASSLPLQRTSTEGCLGWLRRRGRACSWWLWTLSAALRTRRTGRWSRRFHLCGCCGGTGA